MKALRKYLDKIKPNFQKGGKLHKFHSTFDALETFLYVPNKVTHVGAHIRDAVDMKRTMIIVVMALVPTLLFGMWNVGFQYYKSIGQDPGFWSVFFFGFLKVLPIVIVSYVAGLTVEFIFAQFRGHEVNEGFLVSGMLIPLTLPPNIPLWMVAIATIFAVVFGKEVFGGTGMNIFNPALLARAFLFFAYPAQMSGDLVWTADLIGNKMLVDGFSGATSLSLAASASIEPNIVNATEIIHKIPDIWTLFVGTIPGSIGETSKLAILIGAGILAFTGIASLRIMLSAVVGGLTMAYIFNLAGSNVYMQLPPYQHLLMGGFLFAVVFMATDPVSAAQTPTGKIIYGFLVGMFSILIRVINPAYPEGAMLAVLFMNCFAPLIDHYVVESHIKRRLKRAKQKSIA